MHQMSTGKARALSATQSVKEPNPGIPINSTTANAAAPEDGEAALAPPAPSSPLVKSQAAASQPSLVGCSLPYYTVSITLFLSPMSLFASLFSGGGGEKAASGDLFADNSRFKAAPAIEAKNLDTTGTGKKSGAASRAAGSGGAPAAAAAVANGAAAAPPSKAAGGKRSSKQAAPEQQKDQQQNERRAKKAKHQEDKQAVQKAGKKAEEQEQQQEPDKQHKKVKHGKEKKQGKEDKQQHKKQAKEDNQQRKEKVKEDKANGKEPAKVKKPKKQPKEKQQQEQAPTPAADPTGSGGSSDDDDDDDNDNDDDEHATAAAPAAAAAAAAAAPPPLTPEEAAAKAAADAEKLRRTVFVGNLPVSTTRKELSKLFGPYGRVESARLRSVPVSLDKKMPRRVAIATGKVDGGRGGAHGYVVFKEAAGAAAALAANMSEVRCFRCGGLGFVVLCSVEGAAASCRTAFQSAPAAC